MSKICGYSCEHNKGGVCQITNCDKKIMMTTTTEPQVFTRWQDFTIEEYKQLIKNWKEKYYQIKKEKDKYKQVIDKIKELLVNHIDSCDASLSNPEHTIVNKHSLLKIEKDNYKNILDLLEEINE